MLRLDDTVLDQLLHYARQKAAQLDTRMSIALCDPGGHLLAFHRMAGAFAASADIAKRKAKTAALFSAPSQAVGAIVREHELTGFELSNAGLMLFGGGLPIQLEGQLLGAIGVSGGSAEQDVEVAQAALEVLS